MAHSVFPPRLKQTFAFQPFRLFFHSFWGKCNSVSLHFRLQVYKWSPVYPTLSGRILHWQTAWSKHLNKALLILSDLESLALPYIDTNHCYQSVPRISIILRAWNCPVLLWESDLSLSKVYKKPQGYAEGSPLTLRNHFIQPYKALDTLFSEYY